MKTKKKFFTHNKKGVICFIFSIWYYIFGALAFKWGCDHFKKCD